MSNRPHARTAYVHVGTHKTGTTSIQALLALNEPAFRYAGVLIPQAGRSFEGLAAHHNIAWELTNDARFNPGDGTFAELLREVAASEASTICLSSEEFEFLFLDERALRRLVDGLRDAGCAVKIVCYLRPQADYLESLYAEISREWDVAFADYFETILDTGIYGRSCFDYARLLKPFCAVAGDENVIVDVYRSAAPTSALLQRFTKRIAPHVEFARLATPGRLNPMATFVDVIAARERYLDCVAHHRIRPDQPFDPLGLLDIARLALRFGPVNALLQRAFGVGLGSASSEMLVRELISELLRDRESRHRKRLIRVLAESELDIAA